MAFRPSQPAICGPDKRLAYTDRFLGDPVYGRRGYYHSNHGITRDCAVLLQRLGRSPYALKSNVAMRSQTNAKRFANFRFLMRYPARSNSMRAGSLGQQSYCSSGWEYNQRKNTHPLIASTPQITIAAIASRRSLGLSIPTLHLLPVAAASWKRVAVFLGESNSINTQPCSASSNCRTCTGMRSSYA